MIVRIIPTEEKTALAGATVLEASAEPAASMAAFNDDRVASRCFGSWGFVSVTPRNPGITWRID